MDTVIWAANNYIVLKVAAMVYIVGCSYAIYKFHQLRKPRMSYKCGKCGIKFNSQAQAKCSRCVPKTVALPTSYAKAYGLPTLRLADQPAKDEPSHAPE